MRFDFYRQQLTRFKIKRTFAEVDVEIVSVFIGGFSGDGLTLTTGTATKGKIL